MPYTEQGKAVMLWSLVGAISHMSLHSGPPVDGHELADGTYRRKQVDFRDALDGVVLSERAVQFDMPAGAHVRYAGFWTSSIGGALLAWAKAPEKAFKGRGVYDVDVAQLDLNCEIELD